MIRELAASEVDSLIPLAREFYSTSKFLGVFDIEKFREIWTKLLSVGGVIFVDDRDGVPAGVIGGFLHSELYGSNLLAEEMFWFAAKDRRGGGIALYKAFEDWARARGAESIQMVHLCDSMPEKLENFYRRMGFLQVETRYSKRLVV